ncbi:hypothetical protein WJ23_31050 [Burkholderia lata]|uniref:hypothetical protein n=1 Tax=Burkholderia lata (strain ATCC 17760 / DSM 23089 / LMG 22485 / NCIMB 9086 / R18194 / 383) TaxID=482957 RepID=UPI000841D91F|nr:hypothetical protein [Burkholderia lata]AOJ42316.1 hypothetical protein WJ23_31050 [Burkholderia lata]
MNRQVSVSGGRTGIDSATAMHFVQRNAQVVLIGQRENVLEHAAEAIGGVFRGAPPVPRLPTLACMIRWNARGMRWQSGSRLLISRSTRPAKKVPAE